MRILSRARMFAAVTAAFILSFPLAASPDGSGLSQHVMTIWTDREGLPSDTILDVVQDHAGYIWLASYDGLVRFDGEVFSVMNAANDGFTGKSARVLELAPDGSLWIGTNTAGLYCYHDGLFTRYGLEDGLPDLSVRSIAIDGEGSVWVGTANGVSRLERSRFVSAVPAGSQKIGIANFLLPLHDGTVIVGTNMNGLWLITPTGLESYLDDQGASSWSFSSGVLDGSGQLWLGTSSGQILRVTRNEIRERFSPEYLNGASVNAFYTDSDGTLWMATDRGILARRDNGFEFFSETNGLPSNVVSSLCKDREGNLWVGTERGGLVKFSQGKFVNTSKRDGLVSDAVNAVTEDRWRSLWVATDEGISFFPSETDPYLTEPSRRAAVDGLVKKLEGVRVRQIRGEQDGSLWFATYSDYGLLVFQPDGRTATITKKDGIPTNRVRFSYRASGGDLWVGTTSGPVRFRGGSAMSFGNDSGLPNLFILCTMEDSAGNVWLGTDGGGVSVYDGSSFRTLTTKDGLAGNVVFRIFHDSANRLWMCTSEGLSLYSDGRFLPVDQSIGLSGESVFEVLEDKSSRLWIITGRKVVVAPLSELAQSVQSGYVLAGCRAYDRLDGLAGQLSANAWSFMNDRGIVYLPTLKGLSTYNPQSVLMNSLPPPVLIEKVMTDGKLIRAKKNLYRMEASDRRITFYYTALSFVVPQRVRFQYKLEGYDRDWISAGVSREIGYTNLPPGNYRFRVKAENNDGVVNEDGAVLMLRKAPFFWQTIPFYVLLSLFFVLAGFFVAYLRVHHLNSRAKELNLLVEERTAELAHEKEQSEKLLRNILPPSVAAELKSTGTATPQVYTNTAVLFADIVGFTPWSATLSPDTIIHELNDIFSAFDDIMGRWGCERIKTIGDGYLACCGLPLPEDDYARKIVCAGMDMLRYLDGRNRGKQTPIEIRIGIDAGPIVGGVVGVRKYIFDVFGDTVNTAFRLEGLSVPMGLTVSEQIARAVESEIRILERPSRSVKGKGQLSTYYVCYREDGRAAMNNHAAIAAYTRGLRLYESGKIDECREVIDSFDYTTVEPEVGYDLYQLASRVWMSLGDAERSRGAIVRSERFRL